MDVIQHPLSHPLEKHLGLLFASKNKWRVMIMERAILTYNFLPSFFYFSQFLCLFIKMY